MNITPLLPDIAVPVVAPLTARPTGNDANLFGNLLQTFANDLQKAQQAESAVANGRGSLLEMSVERARADAELEVAGATISRLSSDLSLFANMAV